MKEAIKQALRTIEKEFGSSVFANPKQFKAALSKVSMETDAGETRKLLCVAVCDMQVYPRLKLALSDNSPILVNLVEEMVQQHSIERAYAQTVIECIAGILDHTPVGKGQDKYQKRCQTARDAYDTYTGERNEIFVSYSKKDGRYATELIEYLEHIPRLIVWDFRKMESSADVNKAIGCHLKKAKIVIQLLSHAYINSQYVKKIERPLIRDGADKQELTPLLLLVGECSLDDTEFEDRQLVNGNHTPINNSRKYPPAERRKLYGKIVKECKKLLGQ